MPRELNLVPALLQESREMRVMEEGIAEPCTLIGAEDVARPVDEIEVGLSFGL